jgi:hypothetical protein
MASLLKNTASQNVTYCMIVASSGAASTTTSTSSITAFVTKDGVQAAAAGTFSYLGSGQWNYAPTQGETNATDVGIFVTMTSNIPCNLDFHTDDFTVVADAFLNRDMSVGSDSGTTTVRTVRQALRFLRNKWTVSSGTLTVYKEDDTTSSWTGTVTSDATAQPIVSSDPAG